MHLRMYVAIVYIIYLLFIQYHAVDNITVNRETFAGLNFLVFCSFKEYCEGFFMNIYLYYASFIY